MEDVLKKLKRDRGTWDAKIVISAVVLAIVLPGSTKLAAGAVGILGLAANAVVSGGLRKGDAKMRRIALVGLPVVQAVLGAGMLFTVLFLGFYLAKCDDMHVEPDPKFVLKNLASAVGIGVWNILGCARTKRLLREPDVVSIFGEAGRAQVPSGKERALQLVLSVGAFVFAIGMLVFLGKGMFGSPNRDEAGSTRPVPAARRNATNGSQSAADNRPIPSEDDMFKGMMGEAPVPSANPSAPSPTPSVAPSVSAAASARGDDNGANRVVDSPETLRGTYELVGRTKNTACSNTKMVIAKSEIAFSGKGEACDDGKASFTGVSSKGAGTVLEHTTMGGLGWGTSQDSTTVTSKGNDGTFDVDADKFSGTYRRVSSNY